jgi:hypothetical protein
VHQLFVEIRAGGHIHTVNREHVVAGLHLLADRCRAERQHCGHLSSVRSISYSADRT